MTKKLGLALLAYIPSWVLAHCAVMLSRGDGLSLNLMAPYFKLAWTFSAGELPGFIWLVSICIYAVVLALFLAVSRRHAASAA